MNSCQPCSNSCVSEAASPQICPAIAPKLQQVFLFDHSQNSDTPKPIDVALPMHYNNNFSLNCLIRAGNGDMPSIQSLPHYFYESQVQEHSGRPGAEREEGAEEGAIKLPAQSIPSARHDKGLLSSTLQVGHTATHRTIRLGRGK